MKLSNKTLSLIAPIPLTFFMLPIIFTEIKTTELIGVLLVAIILLIATHRFTREYLRSYNPQGETTKV